MALNPGDYMFKNCKGETLIKPPGSLNGQSFVLDTLEDCEVYILDWSGQVQIDDCINCKIMIGPTDGSVFIRDCRDCTLCVAARQLRTRDCKNLSIALYCATQPSIETSTGIVFSCWRGAYPGLTEHFAKARLDPTKNTWAQVYDFNSKDDLGAVHYTLDESVAPWWVAPPTRPHGGGPVGLQPDCPVAAPDGSLYGGGRLEVQPPKSPSGPVLPHSLPPSPGRAAGYDEEVVLDDDPEDEQAGAVVLPPDEDDGGTALAELAPAQPSPAAAATAAAAAAQPVWAVQEQEEISGGTGEVATAFSFRTSDSVRVQPPEVGTPDAVPSPGSQPPGVLPEQAPTAAAEALLETPEQAPEAAAETGQNGGVDDTPAAADNGDADDAWFTAPVHPPPLDAAALAAAPAAGAPATGDGVTDARVAWRTANAVRLKQALAAESAAKDKVVAEARAKLDSLKRTREALLKQRHATHRAREASGVAAGDAEARGAAGWAKVGALVDLGKGSGAGGAKPAGGAGAGVLGVGKDVGRMKQLIIALKAKQGPAK